MTNENNNTVTVLSDSKNAIVGSVKVGDDPLGVAIDPSGDIWVADYYVGRVLEFTPLFTKARRPL